MRLVTQPSADALRMTVGLRSVFAQIARVTLETSSQLLQYDPARHCCPDRSLPGHRPVRRAITAAEATAFSCAQELMAKLHQLPLPPALLMAWLIDGKQETTLESTHRGWFGIIRLHAMSGPRHQRRSDDIGAKARASRVGEIRCNTRGAEMAIKARITSTG